MAKSQDAAVVLERVVRDWTTAGPLDDLCDLVDATWHRDIDRYEPRLGDDPLSLGIQASRNILNLAVRRFRDRENVQALDRKTLEVRFAGRTLHIGKAPSTSPAWSVDSIVWSESDVREQAANVNSALFQPLEGTLFEESKPVEGQQTDASMLTQLHMAWQGFADGSVRTWLGFPSAGLAPWFAVVELRDGRGDAGRGGLPTVEPAPSSPNFDAMGEPELPMKKRDRKTAQGESA